MNSGVLSSFQSATKQLSDGLARVWPGPNDSDSAARRAETLRNALRVAEAVLFLAALFVLVRFVFAYLLKLG